MILIPFMVKLVAFLGANLTQRGMVFFGAKAMLFCGRVFGPPTANAEAARCRWPVVGILLVRLMPVRDPAVPAAGPVSPANPTGGPGASSGFGSPSSAGAGSGNGPAGVPDAAALSTATG